MTDQLTSDVHTVFTTLFAEVCQQFNISVPVLGSNGSTNGTNVTTAPLPHSTTQPFVGSAAKGPVGQYVAWMASGLVCVVVASVVVL